MEITFDLTPYHQGCPEQSDVRPPLEVTPLLETANPDIKYQWFWTEWSYRQYAEWFIGWRHYRWPGIPSPCRFSPGGEMISIEADDYWPHQWYPKGTPFLYSMFGQGHGDTFVEFCCPNKVVSFLNPIDNPPNDGDPDWEWTIPLRLPDDWTYQTTGTDPVRAQLTELTIPANYYCDAGGTMNVVTHPDGDGRFGVRELYPWDEEYWVIGQGALPHEQPVRTFYWPIEYQMQVYCYARRSNVARLAMSILPHLAMFSFVLSGGVSPAWRKK